MTEKEKRKENILNSVFLGSVTGASILFGFGMALTMAKKKDPKYFTQGLSIANEASKTETGASLAMRALGWGTFYAVSGFSIFCYATWKLIGAKNLDEFRLKMGSVLPTIPKNSPQGRTEFESVRELLNYIIDEDEKKKK